MPSSQLLEAVAVTAELCGRTFSEPAARVFVGDLAPYPERAVLAALTRCRKEVRGMLTVADVVSRLDDGRPGPEEAWAMLPKSEDDTAVWTEEMSAAFGTALPLIEAGELIPARMAFKEAYQRNVQRSRDAGRPVQWSASLGHDARGREAVLLQAVADGRLRIEDARAHCPALPEPAPAVMALIAGQRAEAA